MLSNNSVRSNISSHVRFVGSCSCVSLLSLFSSNFSALFTGTHMKSSDTSKYTKIYHLLNNMLCFCFVNKIFRFFNMVFCVTYLGDSIAPILDTIGRRGVHSLCIFRSAILKKPNRPINIK